MPCSKLKAIEVESVIKYPSDLPAQAPFSHPSQVKLSKWGPLLTKIWEMFFEHLEGGGRVHKNISQILVLEKAWQ